MVMNSYIGNWQREPRNFISVIEEIRTVEKGKSGDGNVHILMGDV